MSRMKTVALLACFSALGDLPVLGQEARPPTPPPGSERQATPAEQPPKVDADVNAMTAVTVEKLMDQAVKNIAKRYSLNEEQAEKTDEIMKRRVRQFLKDHEAEVWPLIREMLVTNFGTKPPENIDDVKRLGNAGKPLVEIAKKAILEGNGEWRQYLTPAQQRVHDYDLSEMDKTFGEINRRLDLWAEGRPPKEGLFPPPPRPSEGPQPPPRPGRGLPKSPEPQAVVVRESFFDTFVEAFIKDNELDPGQITAARSILNEFKAKVGDFKSSNKEDIAKVVASQQGATEAGDKDALAAAQGSRRELFQPIYQFFDEMESRLGALLTSAQLERYKMRVAVDPESRRQAIDNELLPELPAAKQAAKPTPEKPKGSNGAPPSNNE